MPELRLLVTGASGFVGRAVLSRAAQDETLSARGSVRRHSSDIPTRAETALVGDLAYNTDWLAALRDIDVVVHTAARVHVMRDPAVDSLSEFRRVNVEGTLNLVRQAARCGVRRVVFISSIKVNGEGTVRGRPYSADDLPAPSDPYGISKYEAEQGVWQLANETSLEVVVIRPVLVYGPGVGANFHTLMRLVRSGIPLPLGAIDNRRSLVALDNLVDLVLTCVRHPRAAKQTFLVSDGDDLSTTALLRRTAAAMGKPARLLPVPAVLVEWVARMIGMRDIANRLCGSLQVDITKTRTVLGWAPPVGVDEALNRTVRQFIESDSR